MDEGMANWKFPQDSAAANNFRLGKKLPEKSDVLLGPKRIETRYNFDSSIDHITYGKSKLMCLVKEDLKLE